MKIEITRKMHALVAGLLLSISIGLFGAAAYASGLVNAINPQSSSTDGVAAVVPPLLAPPSGEGTYAIHVDLSSPIEADDHRPIAQLVDPVAVGVSGIQASIDANPVPDAGQAAQHPIYYTVLASVRYQIENRYLLITTSRPSPAAAQMATVFGENEIQIGGTTTAWTSTNLPGGLPNRVVFLSQGLIVTALSELSASQLISLAPQIVVR